MQPCPVKKIRCDLSAQSFYLFQDSTRIHLFLIKCPGVPVELGSKIPTILFLHGNAGNIGHRLANVHGLVKNLGCNVLLVSLVYHKIALEVLEKNL